jgi:hypothetical protein
MLNPKLKFCQGYKRSASNSVKYKVCFTLEEGKSIQFGLDSCKSKAEIAVEISSGFCIHVRTCKDKRKGRCLCYEEFCERLQPKSVCNGCNKRTFCRQIKSYYKADSAHDSYRFKLSDTRQGVNLTEQNIKFKEIILIYQQQKWIPSTTSRADLIFRPLSFKIAT